MTFNYTQYKAGTEFPSYVIKKSQCVQGTWIQVHPEKRWNSHFSGLEDNGERHHVLAAEEQRLYMPFSSPIHQKSRFPRSPCHVTKKDSWHGRVLQTLWSGYLYYLMPLYDEIFHIISNYKKFLWFLKNKMCVAI